MQLLPYLHLLLLLSAEGSLPLSTATAAIAVTAAVVALCFLQLSFQSMATPAELTVQVIPALLVDLLTYDASVQLLDRSITPHNM